MESSELSRWSHARRYLTRTFTEAFDSDHCTKTQKRSIMGTRIRHEIEHPYRNLARVGLGKFCLCKARKLSRLPSFGGLTHLKGSVLTLGLPPHSALPAAVIFIEY